ncbi:hypothetical protein [Flindersiella endophytica]
MPKRLLMLGFACLLTGCLTLTACGSDEPEPRVASVRETASADPTPSPTPTKKLVSPEEWSRLLDACLSEELPDMVGDDGKVSHTKKTDPRFQAAVEKCTKDLPPAEEPEPEPLTPKQLAAQRDYAECMRDNGIDAFPDPDPEQKDPGPNDPQPPYGATNAEWQRAFDKCYGIIDPMFTPGVGQG